MTEGYWLLREGSKSYAPYKNDVLKMWQDALRERGITNKNELLTFAAQAMRENGSLSPLTIGDNGCSLGLPQRNFCSHAGIEAKTALKKWPEWHTLEKQVNWFADRTKKNMDAYDNQIKWAVIAHNCPVCASKGYNNGYWEQVQQQIPLFVWTEGTQLITKK